MASYAVAATTTLLCALLFFSLETGALLGERYVEMAVYTGHSTVGPAKPAEVDPVNTGGPTWFGSINMRDRPLADGPDDNANIVGRVLDAQFKVFADTEYTWATYMTLVFKNSSWFSGSTLQVGGLNTLVDTDWAILGGTGNLTMARGIVHRKLMRNGQIAQYKVYAYYTPMPFIAASGHELNPNM